MKNYFYDIYGRIKNLTRPVQLHKKSEKTKALFAVGVVSFFWGTTWLASKKGVEQMPALQLSGIRQLLAGIIYIIFFSIKGYKIPSRQLFFQLLWMSMLMFVINNGFSTWSVEYLPSGLGAVISSISPIWIAIFSVFLFKEAKLNLMTVAGLILGFAGILIIFYDYLQQLFNPAFIRGVLLGLGATMTWALGTLYTAQQSKSVNPYYSLGWQMFLGGIQLTVLAYLTGQHIPLGDINWKAWASISYLVVIGSLITFAAFIYSLKRLPVSQVSVHAYINPIVAVIVGSLLNHEKLNGTIALGTLVTILGIYLVNTGFRRVKISKEDKSDIPVDNLAKK